MSEHAQRDGLPLAVANTYEVLKIGAAGAWEKSRLALKTKRMLMCLAISPDRRFLGTVDFNREIELWNLSACVEAFALEVSKTGAVGSLFYAGDGQWFGAAAGTCTISNTQSLRTRSLPGAANLAALSPDGRVLATADTSVSFWHPGESRLLAETRPLDGRVTALSFHPDSKSTFVAIGPVVYRAIVPEEGVDAGLPLLALDDSGPELRAVAFSPDGRSLLTGDAKGRVHLRSAR